MATTKEVETFSVKFLQRRKEIGNTIRASQSRMFLRLRDAQESSDAARHEAVSIHVQLAKLDAHLSSLLMHLHESVETPTNASVTPTFLFQLH